MFTQALNEIYKILTAFLNFMFEQTDIGGGVTIGYILISIGLTATIISTLAAQVKKGNTHITVRNEGGHNNGRDD